MVVLDVMCHGESSAREARAKILVYILIYIYIFKGLTPVRLPLRRNGQGYPSVTSNFVSVIVNAGPQGGM